MAHVEIEVIQGVVKHDGKSYSIGETLTIPEEQAE